MAKRGLLLVALLVLAVPVLALPLASCTTPAAPKKQSAVAPQMASVAEVKVVKECSVSPSELQCTGTLANGSKVVVLAWNDLGMHCYNADFSSIGVLPPYNNLHAQVIRTDGEMPEVITKGITVEYSYPENTYSVGGPGKPSKSNFWTYAKQLFGADLKPDVGLTGKGLTGTLDVQGNQFVAEGIPVTDQRDVDAGKSTIYPYQLAQVVVKDSDGTAVAKVRVVTPVSTEMRCDNCHADDGDATAMAKIKPTGDVYKNILAVHDKLQAADYKKLGAKPLLESTPVLCASCHSSNALKAAGKPGVSSLSNAMHNRHSMVSDITADTKGCQNCHPGPQTKCLRDVHAQTLGYGCPDCHGDLKKVASNKDPWLNEPRCDNPACHKKMDPMLYKQDKPLYRMSVGHHGGIQCEACHDSTHAVAQSREVADGLKYDALQGDPSYVKQCKVCHGKDRPEGQTKVHHPHD